MQDGESDIHMHVYNCSKTLKRAKRKWFFELESSSFITKVVRKSPTMSFVGDLD